VSYVFDSWAILAYFNKEKGGYKVKEVLQKAKEKEETVYMHKVNLGEVFYIIYRRKGREDAFKFINWLKLCPITFVNMEDRLLFLAGEIKATHSTSYADAFVIATSKIYGVKILTGDPEFKNLKGIVEIEWI
jgi:ribonuclease VapC